MSITFNGFEIIRPSKAAAPSRQRIATSAVATGRALMALVRRIAEIIETRRAERQLLGLGEAGMKDIGIGRGGAGRAARHGRDR